MGFRKKSKLDESHKEDDTPPEPKEKKHSSLFKKKSKLDEVEEDRSEPVSEDKPLEKKSSSSRFLSPFKKSKSKTDSSNAVEENSTPPLPPVMIAPPPETPVEDKVESVTPEEVSREYTETSYNATEEKKESSRINYDRYESITEKMDISDEPEPEQNTFCGLVCCY